MLADPSATAARVVLGTEPYPWPWDGDLRGSRHALVVTGVQPALVVRTRGAAGVIERVQGMATAVRHAGGLVVWVHHRLRDDLDPKHQTLTASVPATDVVLHAGGIDGFHASALDDTLRRAGRDQLVLAGVGLETTVHSTLRSANDRGYECLTLADAVAPHDASLQGAALSSICMSGGIFGAVGTSRALLDALSLLN